MHVHWHRKLFTSERWDCIYVWRLFSVSTGWAGGRFWKKSRHFFITKTISRLKFEARRENIADREKNKCKSSRQQIEVLASWYCGVVGEATIVIQHPFTYWLESQLLHIYAFFVVPFLHSSTSPVYSSPLPPCVWLYFLTQCCPLHQFPTVHRTASKLLGRKQYPLHDLTCAWLELHSLIQPQSRQWCFY